MSYFLNIIGFIGSFIIGGFAWPAILIPILVVIPRSIKRRGKFPLSTLFSIIFWSAILYFGTKYLGQWQPDLFWGIIIGLSVSGIGMLKKAITGGIDMEEDIRDTYGEDLSNLK